MQCQTTGYRERSWSLRLLTALVLLGLSGQLKALIGGQPDLEGRFGSVVSLRTDPGQSCTATKIGARHFLTAAHCVIDIPSGALAEAFQPGGQVLVSNWPEPSGAAAYQTLTVAQTHLPASFAAALGRLHAYQEGRIADFRARYSGEDLERRIRRVHADSHIMARFPDLAIVEADGETPSIPVAPVDLNPLASGAEVVLVGYGCERVADLAAGRLGSGPVRRIWGISRVIRVGAVNFYTFAGDLRAGTPTPAQATPADPCSRTAAWWGCTGPSTGSASAIPPDPTCRSTCTAWRTGTPGPWPAGPLGDQRHPGRAPGASDETRRQESHSPSRLP